MGSMADSGEASVPSSLAEFTSCGFACSVLNGGRRSFLSGRILPLQVKAHFLHYQSVFSKETLFSGYGSLGKESFFPLPEPLRKHLCHGSVVSSEPSKTSSRELGLTGQRSLQGP